MNGSANGNGNGNGEFHVGALSRIFNIGRNEWFRVGVCWFLNFFFRFGFVIGWIVITAMFVNRFGIANLPYLFLAGAALTIVGTILYSEILHRVKKEMLMFVTIVLASIALLAATVFPEKNQTAFFIFTLVAASLFLQQLHILIALFTPLESQRTFPVIDSSETLGGMLGGLAISLFASSLVPFQFFYIWIIALFLIVPALFVFSYFSQSLPALEVRRTRFFTKKKKERLHEGWQAVRTMPFLKGLLLVVLFQWIFVNLLEFQYTKAVQQWVMAAPEETLVERPVGLDWLHASVLSPDGGSGTSHGDATEPGSLAAEVALTYQLGSLFTLFSGLALLVQLFLASRLISSLGIVGSLLLHPVLILLSLAGMFFRFNFITAVIARMNFEITYIIHSNAYHASYYAFRRELREHVREFLEGFIRPLGIMAGMVVLIVTEQFLIGRSLSAAITLLMTIIAAAMLGVTMRLREKYTRVAAANLHEAENDHERFTAIDILTQRGHKNAPLILRRALEKQHTNGVRLKKKILGALGALRDFDSLPHILNALDDPAPDVRLAAVNALAQFHAIGEKFYTQAFARYQIIHRLQELFEREDSERIRAAIVRVFAHLKDPDAIPFLLRVLEQSSEEVKATCLYVFGMFRDVTAACYIEPHLTSQQASVRAHAIQALWQFPQYRANMKRLVLEMLDSPDQSMRCAAIDVIGGVGAEWGKPYVRAALNESDHFIRLHAAIALVKLGDSVAIEALTEFLMTSDTALMVELKRLLQGIGEKRRKPVERFFIRALAHEVDKIINETGQEHFESFDTHVLERLRTLYDLVGRDEELSEIEHILRERRLAPRASSIKNNILSPWRD